MSEPAMTSPHLAYHTTSIRATGAQGSSGPHRASQPSRKKLINATSNKAHFDKHLRRMSEQHTLDKTTLEMRINITQNTLKN